MSPLVSFMASPAGRLLRIAAGSGLIAWGLLGIGRPTGPVVAAVGVVPLLAGLLDLCLLAPLFGCPLSGARIRGARP